MEKKQERRNKNMVIGFVTVNFWEQCPCDSSNAAERFKYNSYSCGSSHASNMNLKGTAYLDLHNK